MSAYRTKIDQLKQEKASLTAAYEVGLMFTTGISRKTHTVKSFKFMGIKFCGLTMMGMFVDTYIRGFKIICKIT